MTYEQGKEAAREYGKQVELYLQDNSTSWEELAEIQNILYKKAKRYGLVREFKENGLL